MSKKQSNTLSIRFSGDKQLSFLKEVEELALRTGGKPGPFMRNLAIIGYAFFKQGANLGFDGNVVMNRTNVSTNQNVNNTEEHHEIELEVTNISNQTNVNILPKEDEKKSSFLD